MKYWLGALLFGLAISAGAETWHFGLIGDVPYSDYERREVPLMMERIADSQVDFVAHIGDFKHGSERCDDSLFADRHQLFDSNRVPFIFVPGDNEWTDCERLAAGAYDPLERLNKLRSLFWKDGFSLGQKKLPLERQPGAYAEHARFRLGPVLFVSLNIPGGHNNFGLTKTPGQEYLARNPVVLAWLADSFALARREKLPGILLLFQANPGFRNFSQGLGHSGYKDFLELLQSETGRFSGQVVAIHGDSHMSRIDHPLRDAAGKPLPNFTRVETFGYPIMGWTRGTIDTESPKLFRFETHRWPDKGN